MNKIKIPVSSNQASVGFGLIIDENNDYQGVIFVIDENNRPYDLVNPEILYNIHFGKYANWEGHVTYDPSLPTINNYQLFSKEFMKKLNIKKSRKHLLSSISSLIFDKEIIDDLYQKMQNRNAMLDWHSSVLKEIENDEEEKKKREDANDVMGLVYNRRVFEFAVVCSMLMIGQKYEEGLRIDPVSDRSQYGFDFCTNPENFSKSRSKSKQTPSL